MRRSIRRHRHDVPGLNTAALPDLIFTVLFFFMLVTHMRQVELKVRYDVPQGTQLEKLTHKSSVSHIYIGRFANSADTTFHIQLGNHMGSVADIPDFITAERSGMSAEDQQRMTVSIHADSDVPMAIIVDVKQALQKAGALKINYSAREAK